MVVEFPNETLALMGCKEVWAPNCSMVDGLTCELVQENEEETLGYYEDLHIDEDGCFVQYHLEATHDFSNYKQFSKAVGLITIVLSSFGILGNILSITVLVLKETKNCFNQLLIALNVFDSLHLVFAIFEGLRTDFNDLYLHMTKLSPYFFPFVHYPFYRICMCASIFLIIGVGVERYLAVCRPHHYRELQVQSHRALVYIIPSVLAALALNFPRFLELTVADWCIDMELCDCGIKIKSFIIPSDMRNHPLYVLYYTNLAWLLFSGIVPFIVLIILNLQIYRAMQIVKKNLRRNNPIGAIGGAALSAVTVGRSPACQFATEEQAETRRRKRVSQQNKECNLAFILICTVVTFFLCHIPRVMTNVYEALIIKNEEVCKAKNMGYVRLWYLYVIVAINLLLVLNATANLPIYLFGGKSFKASFISLFGLDKWLLKAQNLNTCETSPQTEMRCLEK